MKRNLAVMALVVSIFAKASSGVPAAHCAYADAPLALPSNNQYAALQDIAACKAATRSIQNNYLLMRLVREVIQLDSNQNSPLVQLNNAFVAGSDVDDVSDEALAKTDDMINAAIAYIQSWLADQNNNVSAQQAVRINRMLNLVSTMLNNDAANAAKRTEPIINEWDEDDDADDRANTFKVYKRAKFYKDVTFKDKASFDHFVGFHGNVHFHKNVEIGGSLSVADEIVNCDLTVGCNISMSDSVSPEIGNVIKNGNPFIHTYPGSASQNTFVGENAGNFSITTTQNTAFGNGAMQNANPANGSDIAIGNFALQNDNSANGGFNVAIGYQAMQNASSVFGQDVAIGYQALLNDQGRGLNVAIGFDSMQFANPSGGQNVAIGSFALRHDVSLGNNTAVGVGNLSRNTMGYDNTAVGQGAMGFNDLGAQNVALGVSSMLLANTSYDVAVGMEALMFDQSGNNVAVGYQAMLFNESGSNNVAIGNGALYDSTGSGNVAVGASVYNGGNNNVAMGSYSGIYGDNNVLIGTASGNVGNENVFLGGSIGYNASSDQNVAIGYQSMLSSFSTNGGNTAIGYQTLANAQGGSNIALGYNAGIALNSTESNDIYIGSVGVAGESNTIRIGDQGIYSAAYMQGIYGAPVGVVELPVCVDSTGKLGTCPSSKRFKQNIADMAQDSEGVYSLRPVSFSYISDETDTKQYGLIAEEVAEIFPSLVVYDRDEQPLSVRYQVLPILLLNEVQKQHEIIEQQDKKFSCALEKQDKIIDNMYSRLLALEHN